MQLPELSPWAGSVGQHCRSFLSLKTGLKSCTSVVLAEDEKDIFDCQFGWQPGVAVGKFGWQAGPHSF